MHFSLENKAKNDSYIKVILYMATNSRIVLIITFLRLEKVTSCPLKKNKLLKLKCWL